jgi:hypothetical protein
MANTNNFGGAPLSFIPLWIKVLMALVVMPGIVLSGFLLFPAYSDALGALSDLRITSIWDVNLMLTSDYLGRAATFLAIIALLLGAAAIFDMVADDETMAKGKGNASTALNASMAYIYAYPSIALGALAIVIAIAFVVLMAIPTMFVFLWNPIMVGILLVALAVALVAFITTALPFGRV